MPRKPNSLRVQDFPFPAYLQNQFLRRAGDIRTNSAISFGTADLGILIATDWYRAGTNLAIVLQAWEWLIRHQLQKQAIRAYPTQQKSWLSALGRHLSPLRSRRIESSRD